METVILLLCIKIFFVRIIDVSLETIRTILNVKERRLLASIVGLVETAVWFGIVSEALSEGPVTLPIILSYAGGFAVGTYVGGMISSKFIDSTLEVTVIFDENDQLIKEIRNAGFPVTVLDAKGKNDSKHMLYIKLQKKELPTLGDIIDDYDSEALIIANEATYFKHSVIK